MPAKQQPDDRQFKIGDKVRVNLHHGKIEDAIIRAVIQHIDGIRLQVGLGSAVCNSHRIHFHFRMAGTDRGVRNF